MVFPHFETRLNFASYKQTNRAMIDSHYSTSNASVLMFISKHISHYTTIMCWMYRPRCSMLDK